MEVIDVSSISNETSKKSEMARKLLTGFDIEATCHAAGNDMKIAGSIHSLVLDAARYTVATESSTSLGLDDAGYMHQRILEPCDVTAEYSAAGSEKKGHFVLDQFVVNLSPDILNIVADVERQLLDPLLQCQIGRPTAPCTEYHAIYATEGKDGTSHGIAFWRPEPPSGYAILGDVAVVGDIPLTQQASPWSDNKFKCFFAGLVYFPQQWICHISVKL